MQAFSSFIESGGELGKKPSRSLGLMKESKAHLQKAMLSTQKASCKRVCDSPKLQAKAAMPRGAISKECNIHAMQDILSCSSADIIPCSVRIAMDPLEDEEVFPCRARMSLLCFLWGIPQE